MTTIHSLWLDFMNGTALLQQIDSSFDLDGDETLCMFLNLYHCMLLHAFLVVGVPSSPYKWPSFFGSYSYEAFGDVFSLVELEHNIIRAGMSKPSVSFVSSVLPSSRFSFSLNRVDYRLLWAVNCGSRSMYPSVPIFVVQDLDKQLDACVRYDVECKNAKNSTNRSVRIEHITIHVTFMLCANGLM